MIRLQARAWMGSMVAALALGAGAAWGATEDDKLAGLLNAEGIEFGSSVAIDGDWAVVGAPREDSRTTDEGAAYVFERSFGAWSLEQRLVDPDADIDDAFGTSAAISGTTLAVGADGGNTQPGKVYLYALDDGAWVLQQIVSASDGTNTAGFGQSVALEGDTLLVGAPLDSTNTGAVYVFTRDAGTWAERVKLTASDATEQDRYGTSVSLAESTAAVGASGRSAERGAVYVLTGAGASWAEQEILTASDGATLDAFGWSVSVDSNLLVAGAPGWFNDSGAAYVFLRVQDSWSEFDQLFASDESVGNQFGYSVSLSSGRAIVGAPFNQAGAAYIFSAGVLGWTEDAKLTAAATPAPERVGVSVSLDDTFAVFGASLTGLLGENSGSAEVHVLDGAWQREQRLSPNTSSGLGSALAASGDTLVIGARNEFGIQGAAYVLVNDGGVWTLEQRLDADMPGVTEDLDFGARVAIDGDTLAVAAVFDDELGTNAGAVYVFTRDNGAWTLEERLTASDGARADAFGNGLALEGDTLLVGASTHDLPGADNAGAVYVFTREAGDWTEVQKLTLDSPMFQDAFGGNVALQGGRAAVTVSGVDELGPNTGGVALYERGMDDLWSLVEFPMVTEPESGIGIGDSLALDGDTLAVSSVDASNPNSNEGAVYVFIRCSGGWVEQQRILPDPEETVPDFGHSLALRGDLLLVGSPRAEGPELNSGAAYLYRRTGGVWSLVDMLTASDGGGFERFGSAVAFAADQVLVGADDQPGLGGESGAAYAYDLAPFAAEGEGGGAGEPFDGCPAPEGEGEGAGEGGGEAAPGGEGEAESGGEGEAEPAMPTLAIIEGDIDQGIEIQLDNDGEPVSTLSFFLGFEPERLEVTGASLSPAAIAANRTIDLELPQPGVAIVSIGVNGAVMPIPDGPLCIVSLQPGPQAEPGAAYGFDVTAGGGDFIAGDSFDLPRFDGQVRIPEAAEGEGGGEGAAPFHSGDTNNDGALNLSELVRIVQLYNAGGYACDESAEPSDDGYVSGDNPQARDCDPHASDYAPQDWALSLSELLRAVQFYAIGGYAPQEGTEDGYTPDTGG